MRRCLRKKDFITIYIIVSKIRNALFPGRSPGNRAFFSMCSRKKIS